MCVCACRVPPMSIAYIRSQSACYQPNAYRINFRQTIYQQICDYLMTTEFFVIHFFPVVVGLWSIKSQLNHTSANWRRKKKEKKQTNKTKQTTTATDGQKRSGTWRWENHRELFSLCLVLFYRYGFDVICDSLLTKTSIAWKTMRLRTDSVVVLNRRHWYSWFDLTRK